MENKVVVITGGSEGLGKVVAKKLAQLKAKVVIVAFEEDKLKATAQEIGNDTKYYVCDISESSQVTTTVQQIIADFGKVDVLINNAGVWTEEELEKTKPEQRKRVFEVNAYGNIEFTKALEPTFKQQNYGHILNVISVSGTDDSAAGDNSLWQTYGASKWALAGFTRALRDSLIGTGIKVTGLYPGGFESNLYENAGNPDEVNHNQPWMMSTESVADSLIFCLTRPEDMLVEKMVVTKFVRE
jgi:short-subunit dehydrogenase